MLDTDKSGTISADELKDFFHLSNKDDDYIKEMIEEVDENKDGVISFKEFKNMMIS